MIILKERLWLYSKKIAKQMLFKKFDCDDEIYISEIYLISVKYISLIAKKNRWVIC